jgi:uncharacterized Zn-binding protein involved in type VI secretion
MSMPAARSGDPTAHGGVINPAGCSMDVFINGQPAATVASMHTCPMVTPGIPSVPHVGGPVVSPGVPAVLINGLPAIGVGDTFFCAGSPPAQVVAGSPNVMFGSGVGASPSPGHATAAGTSESEDEDATLTIKDFAEIFESIQEKHGYEAAQNYIANDINYLKLNDMAMDFANGRDENPDNDPNIMPTRFMLLYGADDGKLSVDSLSDCFEDAPEHDICVANLRKALAYTERDLGTDGAYDNSVYSAFLGYLLQPQTASGNGNLYLIDADTDELDAGREYGDKRIAEKGGNPERYKSGVRYRYPWARHRVEVTLGGEYDDRENIPYEIYSCDSGELLEKGDCCAE